MATEQIPTTLIADDAVTNAKIGVDAVSTTEIANDASISTSGNIATTGSGTLTVAGASTFSGGIANSGTISAGTIGSSVTGNWGWKLLQTVSGNDDVAYLDVGSTDGGTTTLLTNTYSAYKIIISDLSTTGGSRDLFIQFYKGSALKTNEYDYTLTYNSSQTNGHVRSNSADYIRCNGAGINNYNTNSNPTRFQGLHGEINLIDPASSQFHFIQGIMTYHNSANYNENAYFSGGNGRNQSHNGSGNGYDPLKFLRFYWSGENIYRGTIRLYGVINA